MNRKKYRKIYRNSLSETQLINRVYKLKLFDNTIWINLDNGFFEDNLTGNKLPISTLYPMIYRGYDFYGKQVAGRKYPQRSNYRPVKEIHFVL